MGSVWILPAVIAVGFLLVFIWRFWHKKQLEKEPMVVTARISDIIISRGADHGDSYGVELRYDVEDTTYTARLSFSRDDVRYYKVGDKIAVKCQRSNPLNVRLAHGELHDNLTWGMLALAGLFALLAWVAFEMM